MQEFYNAVESAIKYNMKTLEDRKNKVERGTQAEDAPVIQSVFNLPNLSLSKDSFGSYIVYKNFLLFLTSSQQLIQIAEYETQSEAIRTCQHNNTFLAGVGTGCTIAHHID